MDGKNVEKKLNNNSNSTFHRKYGLNKKVEQSESSKDPPY
jgi:hypothetical protein